MPHDHHHHRHVDPDAGDLRVAAAIGVNVLLTVAQIIGGLVSGSLALIADAEADVVVSTHPLLTRSVVHCLKRIEKDTGKRAPFGIVVTDLVTGHWSWYDADADRIFVPTPEAFDRVEEGGVDPGKLLMTGQAVHPKCGRAAARRVSPQRAGQ